MGLPLCFYKTCHSLKHMMQYSIQWPMYFIYTCWLCSYSQNKSSIARFHVTTGDSREEVKGQSLPIVILIAPLGGLCHRKMLAFSSTQNNKRQCWSTIRRMAADVTKPQVSKKNRQQTNLGAFWTRGLTDTATPRKPQIESFAVIYWELLQHLGTRTGFYCGGDVLDGLLIFLMYRLERTWCFTAGRAES